MGMQTKARRSSESAPASAYADWKLPRRYRPLASIGTGSYGHVIEALDTELNRKVAIKRCGRLFEDLVDCKRILREVALLAQLDHDTVVRLHDFIVPEPFETFDEVYLVLEIADSDFKKLCRTPVFLSELHVVTIFYHLLCGVKYLGDCGIYHRDLKPANCLVNQDCTVKICDFGLARAVLGPVVGDKPAAPALAKRALTGHVVTRWYRAPELILLEHRYDAQIDIWSCGCILAELLGMMKANIPDQQNRGPLFPGSSCFPLSPEKKSSKSYSRGQRDQLKMIFDVIGTPEDEELDAMAKDAKAYVRKQFSPRPAIDFKAKYPGASRESVDLLEKMLRFDARKRITIDEALRHPCFKGVKSCASPLPEKPPSVHLPFEGSELTEKDLRKAFLAEMRRFHPA